MNGLALFGMIMLFLLICTALGFIRGLAKSRIRCITVIVCAVVAFIVTMLMKNSLFDVGMIESMGASAELLDAIDTLMLSNAVTETLYGMASALLMPLFFAGLFFVLCFATWIVHLIATLILRRRLREVNERLRHRALWTVLLNLLQGLVVVFVLLVPINVYSQVSISIVEAADDAEMLDDMPDVAAMVEDYISPIGDSFVLRAFRTLGGEPISYALVDFDVEGRTVHLCDEVDAFSDVVFKTVSYIGNSEGERMDTDALITLLADSFDSSELIPPIVCDLLCDATDAWNRGEDYIGLARPESGELFDELIADLIRILHDDSQNETQLRADLYTVADLIVIMDENGVLSNLNDDDALTDSVGSNGVVKKLTAKLEENESMKVLIPTIDRIGMRAIATSLDLDGVGRAEYDEMLTDIADSLNSTASMSREVRVEAMTDELEIAFADAEVEIDREILTSYAENFIDQFGTADDLTADDVSDYLLTYTIEG
ncbi:MAG: hypothetical protein IJW16_08835 [Clostridia bacterium]|nr:hypothetical protein [Clostridia bacterium]